MGMDEFDHESIQDRQSIRQYLKTLKEGLKNGSLMFASENEKITLTPAEMMRLSVKTKKKDGKSKLSIKLSWDDSTVESSKEKSISIHIAS